MKEKHGPIDTLFADAGSGEVAPIGPATEARFDNLRFKCERNILTVQKTVPLFKDADSIILDASVANVIGLPSFAVYAATKAAVRSSFHGWAVELKDRNIPRECGMARTNRNSGT